MRSTPSLRDGSISHRRAALPLLIAVALTTTGCQLHLELVGKPDADASSADPVASTVVRVVDDDTISVKPVGDLIENSLTAGEHIVRLLGIDTPDLNKMSDEPAECGAIEATAALRDLLPEGTAVLIEYDSRADRSDRYGRSLAYVSLLDASAPVRMASRWSSRTPRWSR